MSKFVYISFVCLLIFALGSSIYYLQKEELEMNWPEVYVEDNQEHRDELSTAITDCKAYLTNNKEGLPVEVIFEDAPPPEDELRYISLHYRTYDPESSARLNIKLCQKGITKFFIPRGHTVRGFHPLVKIIVFDTKAEKYKLPLDYATLNSFDLTTAPSWKLVILKDRSHEHRVDIDMVPVH
jgi:hypothetical protein